MLNNRRRPVRITVPREVAAQVSAAHEDYLAARREQRTLRPSDVVGQHAANARVATAERALADAYRRLADAVRWTPMLSAALTAAQAHRDDARALETPALPAGTDSGVAS